MGNEQSKDGKETKKPTIFTKIKTMASSVPLNITSKMLNGPLLNVASKFGQKVAEGVQNHPVVALIVVSVVVIGGIVYVIVKKYRGKQDKALVRQTNFFPFNKSTSKGKEEDEIEKDMAREFELHNDSNGHYHYQYYSLVDDEWTVVDVGRNVEQQIQKMIAPGDNDCKQLVAYSGPEPTVATMESKELALNSLVLCQVNAERDDMLNFYVRRPDGQRLTVSAHRSWPVEYLTFIVQHVLGLGPENQQLFYGDRPLTQGTFEENGIQNDAEINLNELGPIVEEAD